MFVITDSHNRNQTLKKFMLVLQNIRHFIAALQNFLIENNLKNI